jgi:hypothetical protein
MIIRRLDRSTYDVFMGNGWDQWTRVRRFHWGIKGLAGNYLQRSDLKAVSASIESFPEGSVENV